MKWKTICAAAESGGMVSFVRIASVMLLLLSTPGDLSAASYADYAGKFRIASAPVHDPKQPLPDKTHAYLSIKGVAAKTIYDELQGNPVWSECGSDHFEKRAGHLRCSHFPSSQEYSCDFSVNLKTGETDSGGFC